MWVWEPLFEWTRQTRTYWSHWSACSGLNFTLPCATDITHTRVVGLSKYFTSHSVQLFDPDESPRLWEWDAEWGSAVSPRGDVFKLDVKKRRLPFVQLPTVQETFFFFLVCLSSPAIPSFPVSLRKHNGQQPSEDNLLRSQDSCVTSVQRRGGENSKQLFFHAVRSNAAKSFYHFLLQRCVFVHPAADTPGAQLVPRRELLPCIVAKRKDVYDNNSHMRWCKSSSCTRGRHLTHKRHCGTAGRKQNLLSLWIDLKKNNKQWQKTSCIAPFCQYL